MATITVTSGQNVSVGSGRTDFDDDVDSGGTLHVLSGGVINDTFVDGLVIVSAGGTANGTFANNDGTQEVFGLASGTLVFGEQFVSAGGTAIHAVVEVGGFENILEGGTAIGNFVSGEEIVNGTDIGALIGAGGVQFINVGAVVDGTVAESGGTQVDNGLASGTVVNVGGLQDVQGGISFAAVVNGDQVVSDGVASGSIVNSDGIETVEDFGSGDGTVVNSGGQQTVYDFSLASGTVVNNGGRQDVYDYANAPDAVVNSGGVQELHDYASATGTIVSGGEQIVADYANASSTEVRRGGIQLVEDYATASATSIDAGGTQIVENSAVAVGTTISSGGTLDILAGATAVSPDLMSGGTISVGGTLLIVAATVSASSGGIVLEPGAQVDLISGQISGLLNIPDGATVNAVSGFNAANTLFAASGQTIVNGGTVEVADDEVLTLSGTVSNTGTMIAQDGGHLVFAGIANGGTTQIIDGGSVEIERASNENVTFQSGDTGGAIFFDAPGSYTGKVAGLNSNSMFLDLTTVGSAGASVVYTPNASHPTTSGVLTVNSGGKAVAKINMVGDYTTADFNLTNDGSHLVIFDPLVAEQKGNAPANIASGTVLEVKAADSGEVTFAGPTGTLWLDHPGSFTGEVASFGAQEGIDMPGITFGARTTLGYAENKSDTGGTLTVKNGAEVAKVALLGNYIATDFVAAADGHGGTLITENPRLEDAPLVKPH